MGNGYDDTSTGDEQIGQMMFYSSRRSWMGTTAGLLAWNREMDPRGGGLRTRKTHWG